MSIQMDEWQSPNEILFSHNTEEILTYLTAWMIPETMILNGISQTHKETNTTYK
jgi:hypothetical protein